MYVLYEIKTYHNEDGAEITVRTPKELDGNGDICDFISKTHNKEYLGSLVVTGPMGQARISFLFPEEYSLKECFDNYEDVGNAEVEKLQKEMQERQDEANLIIPASGSLIQP